MVCMLFLNNDAQQEKDSWKNTAQREYLKVEKNVVQVRNSMGLEWEIKGRRDIRYGRDYIPQNLATKKDVGFYHQGSGKPLKDFKQGVT